MASLASAARDIPKGASSSRDNLTAVAARSVPATVTRSQQHLPTPPNSISPALPPHGLKAQLQKAGKLEPIDSDLDLHDGHDEAAPAGAGAAGTASGPLSPSGFDSAGAITSALLAKYHLPEILLNHGPLAIRHITGYLTTSVPGFASIPPAKARRLVVGALEGRGAGGEGGGLDGDVEFEKVGWGRWDARRRGQPPRERASPPASAASSSGASGIPIGKGGVRSGTVGGVDRSRLHVGGGSGGGSSAGNSLVFSHDDREAAMLETDADKMSLDESASASCSEAPDDEDIAMDDPEDVTDDEDWAAVGAAALRADSYPNMAARMAATRAYNSGRDVTLPGGLRSFSVANTGMARPPRANFDFAALGAATSDAQEREAVEALLRLGSV